MNIKKRLGILLLSSLMMIITSPTTFAKEISQNSKVESNKNIPTYDELSKRGVIEYYNSTTGEYFLWENPSNSFSRASVAKTFSFRIVASVTSSKFTVNSSNVRVEMNSARVENSLGNAVPGYTGYKYCLDFDGPGMLFGKTIDMYVNEKTLGSLTGFKSGSNYSLTVRNPGDFYGVGASYSLVGSGTIYNN